MFFKTQFRVALSFVAVVACLTFDYSKTNAQAQTILYSQPPGSSGVLLRSSWWDPDGSDYDEYVWDGFILASTQSITEVRWRGGYDPTRFGSGGPVLDFAVAIYASGGGGMPDLVAPPLLHYQTGGSAGETAAGNFGGTMMYDYSFTLPTPFQAAAGTRYWVHIEAFQHGIPDWGIAAGTGGDGVYFRGIAGVGDIFYQGMQGDAAFSLLGPTSLTKATLISPSGAITTATPNYTWNAVSNSTRYCLRVDDSTGNKITQWYTATEANCSSGTGICSVTPATVLAAGSATWWIQTGDSNGDGPWSDSMGFIVPAPPVLPGKATLLSPSGTIGTNLATYTWNAVSNSTRYCLRVDDSTGNKITQWYTATETNCSSGTGICSVTPATVLAAGSATWWIQTGDSNGDGPWSDSMGFIVPATVLPAKATLLSPSGTIDTNLPTYTWNAVPDSTWYCLWVNDGTGRTINQWYTNAQANCFSGTGTCSVAPGIALAPGSAKWWVQTWNSIGYGPWSDAMAFTVPIPPPPGKVALVSPVGTTSPNNWPSFTWNVASNTTWYLLWVNDSMGNPINSWYSAATNCSGGTCSAAPGIPLASGAVTWWVQSWSPNGYGPWSDAGTFTAPSPVLPGKVTLLSPSGSISATAQAFSWNADAQSSWYWLWVDDSTGNKISQWYTAAQAGCGSGSGTCSVSPGVGLAAGSGKWWIETWNPDGYGQWSDGMAFTVN